jgi:hypothetical protein
MTQTRTDWNCSRFKPEDPSGFYESYFQRANHPTRPLAFWIRYTSFIPKGQPDKACGELWAIYFDGETNCITAVKETVPISRCSFSRTQLEARINDATLTDGALHGRAVSPSHTLQWSLRYTGHEPTLLLLPESLYEGGFPKAKALVGTPNAEYTGTLTVDGNEIPIDGWRGSQNHNWGSRHTDRYAWGQVAGFDNAPDAFLECCTAQVKLGPFWSPRLTFVVLRDEGQEIALNGLQQAVRASGNFDFFTWTIDARNPQAHIYGRIHAPGAVFVGLSYKNPPGGQKTCLNTKLASADITIERQGQPPRTLKTMHRAAFEILTDRADHGVAIVA